MRGFGNKLVGVSRYAEVSIWAESFGYGVLCFLLPFVLSHSHQQLLVGTIVNTAVIMCAVRLEWKHALPVILMPSLGVLAAGALFGNLTPFLLFLVPFIWVGNALLAFCFKHFSKKSYWFRALLGAGVKAVFLGAAALTLVFLSLVPTALLLPMSAVQFATALSGSVAAFIALKVFDLFK